MKLRFGQLGYRGVPFLLFLLASCSPALRETAADPQVPAGFSQPLLALADADQIGTAYADGVVQKQLGLEDSLLRVQLAPSGRHQIKRWAVSNSVISWPDVVAVHPQGHYAYVVETRAPLAPATTRVKNVWTDVPTGTLLTVVDLQGDSILQRRPIGTNLGGVSVSPNGDLLVATSNGPTGPELVALPLDKGVPGRVLRFPVAGVRQDVGTDSGLKTVVFHPTAPVVAVNFHTEDLAFFRWYGQGDSLQLQALGSPLRQVAKCWSVGQWTPNGQFFILTDVAWGNGQLGALTNRRGSLVAVAFEATGQHRVVSRAKVGLSPEGFDLSPDGQWAIVANMRRTYLPAGFPYALFGARRYASLSLVRVDPRSGELRTQGREYGFSGELPEDAIFAPNNHSIAVAIYNARYARQPRQGWVEFWERQDNRLVRTSQRIMVTRGVHNLLRLPEGAVEK